MKKLTAILLTLCMCVAVIGCGDTTSTTKETKKTESTTTKTPPGKTP